MNVLSEWNPSIYERLAVLIIIITIMKKQKKKKEEEQREETNENMDEDATGS